MGNRIGGEGERVERSRGWGKQRKDKERGRWRVRKGRVGERNELVEEESGLSSGKRQPSHCGF